MTDSYATSVHVQVLEVDLSEGFAAQLLFAELGVVERLEGAKHLGGECLVDLLAVEVLELESGRLQHAGDGQARSHQQAVFAHVDGVLLVEADLGQGSQAVSKGLVLRAQEHCCSSVRVQGGVACSQGALLVEGGSEAGQLGHGGLFSGDVVAAVLSAVHDHVLVVALFIGFAGLDVGEESELVLVLSLHLPCLSHFFAAVAHRPVKGLLHGAHDEEHLGENVEEASNHSHEVDEVHVPGARECNGQSEEDDSQELQGDREEHGVSLVSDLVKLQEPVGETVGELDRAVRARFSSASDSALDHAHGDLVGNVDDSLQGRDAAHAHHVRGGVLVQLGARDDVSCDSVSVDVGAAAAIHEGSDLLSDEVELLDEGVEHAEHVVLNRLVGEHGGSSGEGCAEALDDDDLLEGGLVHFSVGLLGVGVSVLLVDLPVSVDDVLGFVVLHGGGVLEQGVDVLLGDVGVHGLLLAVGVVHAVLDVVAQEAEEGGLGSSPLALEADEQEGGSKEEDQVLLELDEEGSVGDHLGPDLRADSSRVQGAGDGVLVVLVLLEAEGQTEGVDDVGELGLAVEVLVVLGFDEHTLLIELDGGYFLALDGGDIHDASVWFEDLLLEDKVGKLEVSNVVDSEGHVDVLLVDAAG